MVLNSKLAPDRLGKISKFNFDAYAALPANAAQSQCSVCFLPVDPWLMYLPLNSSTKPCARSQDPAPTFTHHGHQEKVGRCTVSNYFGTSIHDRSSGHGLTGVDGWLHYAELHWIYGAFIQLWSAAAPADPYREYSRFRSPIYCGDCVCAPHINDRHDVHVLT
jgi:hypothetical protein